MMDTKGLLVMSFLLVLLLALSFNSARAYEDCNTDMLLSKGCQLLEECDSKSLHRVNFSNDFVFGAATSAYQIEGAARRYGKGSSIWDTFTEQYPKKILDETNGDAAAESYRMFKLDVAAMKEMGLDAYRFSIAWSRVLPSGRRKDGVNEDGVRFYNDLIKELLDNGIQPYVTIFHWDLPQVLYDEYGGFLDKSNEKIVADYRDYAEFCFSNFGDRVKHWITFNEPWTFSSAGYALGHHAPGRCSEWQTELNCTGGDSAREPYLVAHNILLAHAATVKAYRQNKERYGDGKIGISHVSNWFEPLSETSKTDREAASRLLDFLLGWFVEPMMTGHYPSSMRDRINERLPSFTERQSQDLIGSYDFLGINYYTAFYVTNDTCHYRNATSLTDHHVKTVPYRNGIRIGPPAGSDWLSIYPRGIQNLLIYIKLKYKDPDIYITENGVDEENEHKVMLLEALSDKMRLDYHRDHLCFIQQAIEENDVQVKGYFVWSMLDNYEWREGYTVRFGMNYVDFKRGMMRYPKLSSIWYKNFLKNSTPKIGSSFVDEYKMLFSNF